MIGAGKTGTAAANHLADHGVRNILVLDMGSAGRGSLTPDLVPTTTIPGLLGPHSPASYEPENSGSAVFDCGHDRPQTIKMIVTLPAALP